MAHETMHAMEAVFRTGSLPGTGKLKTKLRRGIWVIGGETKQWRWWCVHIYRELEVCKMHEISEHQCVKRSCLPVSWENKMIITISAT